MPPQTQPMYSGQQLAQQAGSQHLPQQAGPQPYMGGMPAQYPSHMQAPSQGQQVIQQPPSAMSQQPPNVQQNQQPQPPQHQNQPQGSLLDTQLICFD